MANPSAVTQVLWTVRLLGRLEVVSDSVLLTRFRTLKAAALLAYLSLRKGQPQPREELMALLWPDASPEAARNNLSVVLSSLRHQLEPPGTVTERVFTADRQAIGVRAEALTTDVEVFQAAMRARRWSEAAVAYRGPFLPGFYDDWVLLQRETLAQTYSQVIETLVKDAAPNVSERLWEALQRDPDRADFYRELLPTVPLATPHEALYTPTATESPAAPEVATSRGFLPAYPTRFFGRTVERAQLAALLDHTRLVTLLGPGGIGKTRLAIESLVPRTAAGERVYFVPLVDITEGSQLPGALRTALRLPATRDEHTQLQEALTAQPTLLILDNAEQAVERGLPAAVHTLLEGVPTLRLLVTSRKALSVPGEQLFTVAPLPLSLGATDPAQLLATSPAVALFCDRARTVLPDFALTHNNLGTVAALCRRLDGIPLALELAASRARVLTPGQWLERLEKGLEVVATTARAGVPERHRTLLATLRWSYELLSPEVQAFFPTLAVFRGGWSQEAAEAVTGELLALDYLAALGENSLVVSEETPQGMRFRILETIREFAASLQSDPTLATRHAAFFAARAQALSHRQQSGEQQSEALAWFGPEQENLRAALAHTEPHDPSLFLPLALAMGRFWELQGAFSEAVVWLERALAHAPDGAAVERSQALSILGNIANSRGDYAQAEALHTQCLALREASRDEEGVAMALQNLGLIAAARQDYPTANSLYERAIAAHQRVGNALDAASTQVNQANLRGFVGDWAGAEALYRETLSVLEAHDHRRSLGIVYANLCACVANRGEFEEAERFAQRSVSLKEALGDSVGLAQSLDTLAEVQAIRGSDAEACQTQRRSIALLHESTAWRTLPYALFHLAILLAESTPSQAAQLLGAARQQNQQQGITPPPYQQESYQALETRLEAVLGPSAFAQSHTAGGLLSRDETVSLALTTP